LAVDVVEVICENNLFFTKKSLCFYMLHRALCFCCKMVIFTLVFLFGCCVCSHFLLDLSSLYFHHHRKQVPQKVNQNNKCVQEDRKGEHNSDEPSIGIKVLKSCKLSPVGKTKIIESRCTPYKTHQSEKDGSLNGVMFSCQNHQ